MSGTAYSDFCLFRGENSQNPQMVSKIKLLQQLRLNEALFVYVGDDIEKLEKALIKELGYEVAMETLNAVFDLGSAQLPDSVKKSFLDACS